MKLACHFVFDVWIPPWTKIPNMKDCPRPEALHGEERPVGVLAESGFRYGPAQAVYDILAIYAPDAHSGFWSKFGVASSEAYDEGHFGDVNAFRDYAATMMVAKGRCFTARPQRWVNLSAIVLCGNQRTRSAAVKGLTDGSGTQGHRLNRDLSGAADE
ncbi:hypothetical protein DPEC_G00067930 [Dallia pectoralis]|uniref:Uncharacterized protein n=1 Tax=Dallia pectoralis TaxID=75939 RepID=A0ACC2H1J6_DALPE|nr:hypothetical protein DPEC_G00067930 [Dallia pectoralis]